MSLLYGIFLSLYLLCVYGSFWRPKFALQIGCNQKFCLIAGSIKLQTSKLFCPISKEWAIEKPLRRALLPQHGFLGKTDVCKCFYSLSTCSLAIVTSKLTLIFKEIVVYFIVPSQSLHIFKTKVQCMLHLSE